MAWKSLGIVALPRCLDLDDKRVGHFLYLGIHSGVGLLAPWPDRSSSNCFSRGLRIARLAASSPWQSTRLLRSPMCLESRRRQSCTPSVHQIVAVGRKHQYAVTLIRPRRSLTPSPSVERTVDRPADGEVPREKGENDDLIPHGRSSRSP